MLSPVRLVPFLFLEGLLHGTARAGHEILDSTRGTTETHTGLPKGPFRTKNAIAMEIVVF